MTFEPVYIVALGTLTVSGLVGYGQLKARSDEHGETLDKKVDVSAFEQLDKRLERIETKLDRLNGSVS